MREAANTTRGRMMMTMMMMEVGNSLEAQAAVVGSLLIHLGLELVDGGLGCVQRSLQAVQAHGEDFASFVNFGLEVAGGCPWAHYYFSGIGKLDGCIAEWVS